MTDPKVLSEQNRGRRTMVRHVVAREGCGCPTCEPRDPTVEGAFDDLADAARSALAITPAGSWAALTLANVCDQLTAAANQIAAFGIGAEPGETKSK